MAKAVTQHEARASQRENRSHLQRRAPVLDGGRVADAPDVHGGHGGDHRDTGEPVGQGGEGDQLAQIVRERYGERRGRAGVDRQEQRPAEQERGQGAECLAYVDVAATGVGQHGAELAERERAEQREHAAEKPDEQRHA